MEALGRVMSRPHDIESAFALICRRLEVRKTEEPHWKGAMRDLKSVALMLEYHEEACRILTRPQAKLILECALATIVQELNAGGGKGLLNQKFLWGVKSVLLILRHRKIDPTFLSPPPKGGVGSLDYVGALTILDQAKLQAKRPVRHASAIARDAIDNAIQFLQKTGGNPDIIREINKALDDD